MIKLVLINIEKTGHYLKNRPKNRKTGPVGTLEVYSIANLEPIPSGRVLKCLVLIGLSKMHGINIDFYFSLYHAFKENRSFG